MSKKKTHEEFINEIKESYPYIDVLGKYNGTTEKIMIRDNRCGHEYISNPTRIYKKTKCPYCTIHNKTSFEKHIIFENRVYLMYGNEYSVIGKYITAKTPIKIKHNKCGKTFEIRPDNFLHGRQCPLHRYERSAKNNSLSYDEVKQKIYNLVGKEYTLLSNEYINAREKILFRHNVCGNNFKMSFDNFSSKNQRCPKCKSSKGELKIRNYLNLYNIKYEEQKRFDNLVGMNNWKLSYDFYIPNKNLLIEYQGKQHLCSIEYFGGDEEFKRQKEHDKRKREYAKKYNIKLLEIWYYDFDNIENILNEELEIA